MNSCTFIEQFLAASKQLLSPQVCAICGEKSMNSRQICIKCLENLEFHKRRCIHCALKSVKADFMICEDCQQAPQHWDQLICAFDYEQPISEQITGLKYRKQLHNSKALAWCLQQRLTEVYGEQICDGQRVYREWPEVLIPTPLHWSRQAKRGFNQCYLLAKDLSSFFSESEFPDIDTRYLVRHRRTTPQEGLSHQQRQKNLEQVFKLRAGHKHYRHVAILDDVVTTGATANNLSKLLKVSGVEKVDIWAVARTP